MRPFKASDMYAPMGDQPRAIEQIAESIEAGNRFQTILGATGTGKTATMAWAIERLQRPALVIAHNKTLAAQLCNEFREFFPENAVEYFVSYYDYFQPEAYIPQADLYIEKDSSQNDDIARLRLSATSSLLTRRDVVVVASVSCIYGLGSPEEWRERVLILDVGETHDRDEVLRKLIESQYVRNDTVLGRGRFRVKGDIVEIQPANVETAYRVSFFGDEVEQVTHFDPLTGEVYSHLDNLVIWPATEYVTSRPTIERAIDDLRAELEQQVARFEHEGRMLEAHRIRQRTEYDLEMMRELGFCSGIENYSRALEGRPVGSHPFTLIDYFPDDFVCFVDESHQTVPQLGGMYEGDRSRKQTLIDFGFRLPSALDNRPLRFDEFLGKVKQLVFVSATPGPFELSRSKVVAEQLIRPTGVVDPEMELRPTRNQIDDLLNEIRHREEAGERVLVTTLTKKMSEDLTDYLLEAGVRARYLHSEIDTLDRIAIIRELRLGEYDVLVGVNLLREGLDLPEVSLVAVLDADKEGFLRGKTALIQTTGRAARNTAGKVILYADKRTEAIVGAMEETSRRRAIQVAYNEEHGITPESIVKGVSDISELLSLESPHVPSSRRRRGKAEVEGMSPEDLEKLVITLEEEMYLAAEELRFEYAAKLRDEIKELRRELDSRLPRPECSCRNPGRRRAPSRVCVIVHSRNDSSGPERPGCLRRRRLPRQSRYTLLLGPGPRGAFRQLGAAGPGGLYRGWPRRPPRRRSVPRRKHGREHFGYVSRPLLAWAKSAVGSSGIGRRIPMDAADGRESHRGRTDARRLRLALLRRYPRLSLQQGGVRVRDGRSAPLPAGRRGVGVS